MVKNHPKMSYFFIWKIEKKWTNILIFEIARFARKVQKWDIFSDFSTLWWDFSCQAIPFSKRNNEVYFSKSGFICSTLSLPLISYLSLPSEEWQQKTTKIENQIYMTCTSKYPINVQYYSNLKFLKKIWAVNSILKCKQTDEFPFKM